MSHVENSDGVGATRSATSLGSWSGLLWVTWYGLAVVSPILNLLGDSPEFLIAQQLTGGRLLVLLCALCVVVPVVLAVLGSLCARVSRAAFWTISWFGLTVYLLTHASKVAVVPWLVLIACSVCSLLLTLALTRSKNLQWLCQFLAVSPIVFAAGFLLSDAGQLTSVPEAETGKSTVREANASAKVVLVVFDMLGTALLLNEQAEIDSTRYPNFASFATEATWWRNAETTELATVRAIPAMLTGRTPPKGAKPFVDDHPSSLFTKVPLVEGAVLESTTRMCPEYICADTRVRAWANVFDDLLAVYLNQVAPERWKLNLPDVRASWKDFGLTVFGRRSAAASRTDDVLEDLDRDPQLQLETFLERQRNQQGLSYLHVNLPHGPLAWNPSGSTYIPEHRRDAQSWRSVLGKTREQFWNPEYPYLADLGRLRVIQQTMFADWVLGQLVDELKTSGEWRESTLIVAADHGQSFRLGEQLRDLSDAGTRFVALFVKESGQESGRIVDAPVDNRSVFNTVLTAFGLKAEAEAAVSLLDMPGSETGAADSLAREARLRYTQSLFAIGPSPELVGLEVGGQPEDGRVDWSTDTSKVEFEIFGDLQRRDREGSNFVPNYLLGRLVGSKHEGQVDLAIALNGRIEATAQTYSSHKGVPRFAALLPEESILADANQVQIFEILPESERSRSRTLHQLSGPR